MLQNHVSTRIHSTAVVHECSASNIHPRRAWSLPHTHSHPRSIHPPMSRGLPAPHMSPVAV
ncbi:unnamed protein product [Chondrus crispus]|uniref:Uncharacterized protein n=1 Tax=Chondrus crispus TaxID=2769 RepID=R7QFL6_CHOCR|nr:unnamed protein product [Chondrus crispus]CDF37322.1 unnamed protein product [Chondrus crispus]|eukprot:XP_005717141.1 unnamed protein product [Chondrus crispus]